MTARRAAVLGHPVEHSLSPVLHTAAYQALGLTDWRYEACDVDEETVAEALAGLTDEWAGVSLTMPVKQVVLGLVDHVDPLAGVVGAANTVVVLPGGSRPTLVAVNTDVHGIVAALREPAAGGPLREPVRRAVVLGAGATAASALAALTELGCHDVTVAARSPGRTGGLTRAALRMGVSPRLVRLADVHLAGADVVVSTLPPHAADEATARVTTHLRDPGVLLDVAYDPRPTVLGAAWAAAGGRLVGGERMLLHQAAEQVRLMTGRQAPLAAMDAALADALGTPTGA